MPPEAPVLKCDECGAEFVEPNGGGVCVLCLRPFCAQHLGPRKSDVGLLCKSCGGG